MLTQLAHALILQGWDRELLGYLAASLVFATFSMRSMLRLRIVAITSNVTFIYYAAIAHVYPLLILHIALLPMNIHRISQIFRARAEGARLLAQTELSADIDMPEFLSDNALADPATALDLATREQSRAASRLAATLPTEEAKTAPKTPFALLDAIDNFLSMLAANRDLSPAQAATLITLESRNRSLRSLFETLNELATTLLNQKNSLPAWLASNLREGLGTILLIAEDSSFPDKQDARETLVSMTSDRSTVVERMRGRAMESVAEAGVDRRAIYDATALYERTIWLLRGYAQSLSVNTNS